MQQQLSEKCLFDAFGSHNYGKNLSQYAKLCKVQNFTSKSITAVIT